MALVAAIRPKVKGSSTMGAHEEVGGGDDALTVAPMSTTAASSLLLLPTPGWGRQSQDPGSSRWCRRHLGELQPQPAPWLYWVERMEDMLSPLCGQTCIITEITAVHRQMCAKMG